LFPIILQLLQIICHSLASAPYFVQAKCGGVVVGFLPIIIQHQQKLFWVVGWVVAIAGYKANSDIAFVTCMPSSRLKKTQSSSASVQATADQTKLTSRQVYVHF
jgi:hypothetical protein